ncbi:CBS domain-containing protein [Nostocoides sp. F2B08]|uniref:putative nucleotidyltransferase substrate binding domain-containing protein n=1 Tax=Nostocoides sp. F2B08 TaxID=2653936 RepID=UPI001262E8EA|nr:putative nucleotidyltransferase substrate binding domain-containing protein [Tetrasphaera sp. F2B08]KAB7743638.1 CBS domain-containing protein [Tetrasphaera sp. F2B08]
MVAELVEVQEFLVAHAPFEALPESVLRGLPPRLTTRYYRRDTEIVAAGSHNDEMFVLRSGAVEVRDPHGGLVDRYDTGRCFGWAALLSDGIAPFTLTAIEDSLVLVMPGEVFRELSRTQPMWSVFFQHSLSETMRMAVRAVHTADRGTTVLKTKVGDIIRRAPLWVTPATTIRSAAETMRDERVSSLLVMAEDELVGIMTDRDLRNRVVAEGRDIEQPVSAIMTADPISAPVESMAFELLLSMVAKNIHHMPVTDGGRVVGLVSSTDLMRLERANPVYIAGDIQKMTTVEQLAAVQPRVAEIVGQLVTEDATADDIGRVVTAIADAIERRLIELAEVRLGPPPGPYCWLTLGSAGRLEHGLSSDQDHALILNDETLAGPDGDAYADYLSELATFVSDGLAACGYRYCTAGLMATNPQMRQGLSRWLDTVARWVENPSDDTVHRVRSFFDLRPLHGDARLFEELQRAALAETADSMPFLGHLAAQATRTQPPIGFFRGFVLEKGGEHADTLDLKDRGVRLVVDLARVYALAGGLPQVNTQLRLTAVEGTGRLSAERIADLKDAFEFISYVRLRHQARQVRAGAEPDDFVPPDELSQFEKRHLRDAFQIVRQAQSVLTTAYPDQG